MAIDHPAEEVITRTRESHPNSDRQCGIRLRAFAQLGSESRQHVQAVAGTASVNIAITAAGSIGGILLARALGATHRGDLVAVLQWPIVISSIASLGLAQAGCYWISKRPNQAASIISTAGIASVATGIIIALSGLLIAHLIGRDSQVILLMYVTFGLAPAYLVGGVSISALQARSVFHWNVSRLVQPAVYLVGVGILFGENRLNLMGAVSAFVLSVLLQTGYAFWRVRQAMGKLGRCRLSLLRPLYGYGSKLWLSDMPRLVNVRLDQLLLSVWSGVTAASLGNYAVAVSLAALVLPISQAFGSVAFPRIARSASEEHARRTERVTIVGATISSVVIVAVLAAFSSTIVPFVFGRQFSQAVGALWLLAPGAVFLSLNLVLAQVLQGRGRPLFTSVGEGIGAMSTIVLLLILIPRFGIRGAAVASSIAYGVVTPFLFWGLRKDRAKASVESHAVAASG